MRRLRVDFAEPGIRRLLWRTPAVVWALFAIAIVLVAGAAIQGRSYLAELREYESTLAAQAASRRVVPVQEPVRRQQISESQANAINAAIVQLNLPWRTLHDAIDAATPASIALLALEPDARKRLVRITAEARGSDDMIAYVEQLQHQDWILAVTLVRHEINEQDRNRPIRFQVDAQWRAAL